MAILSERGGRIRRRRQELGLTQVELAGRVGVSESSVIRWEGGRMPPSRHRGRLEAVLGIRLDGGPLTAAPLTDARRKELLEEYLRLHRLLFPPPRDGQPDGAGGESVRDEGRTA